MYFNLDHSCPRWIPIWMEASVLYHPITSDLITDPMLISIRGSHLPFLFTPGGGSSDLQLSIHPSIAERWHSSQYQPPVSLVPQQLQILSHRSCIAPTPSEQQGTNSAVHVSKIQLNTHLWMHNHVLSVYTSSLAKIPYLRDLDT
jgi:hypothetical protein